jgi:hypothetical protein
LNQVLKGYKLPSGNPRGLGPKARAALSTHYPNWAALGPSTPATPADLEPNAASSADQALAVLASELRGLSREERRAVAPAIAEFALTPDSEELWDTMLATLRKARAARSARVRAEGGGNDVAASGKRAA